MTPRPVTSLLIPLAVGVAVAIAALVVVLVITDDGGPSSAATTTAATTTAPPGTSSTTATTSATTSTTATTTTTAPATTTTFGGATATVGLDTVAGSPGPQLTDLRVGDHPGYVRVVFDLSGDGTPLYTVGYETPPFSGASGEPTPVDGTAFLVVRLFPALRYDIDTMVPTYTGELVIEPGFDPISQVVFIDDFEAMMVWVIGLTSEQPFTVDVLQEPLRLVIDIAK
jgi:hypothetical protein